MFSSNPHIKVTQKVGFTWNNKSQTIESMHLVVAGGS